MLWIVRLAVCASIVVISASQAHGETFVSDDGAAPSARTNPAGSGKAALEGEVREAALVLPRGGSLAFVEPAVSAVTGPGVAGGVLMGGRDGLTGRRVGLALSEAADDGTGLRYAINKRMTVGLSYERVTDEDMAFEMAESGSLQGDYTSHHVVLQARWAF